MLHYGHQLDVGEAEFGYVISERRSQLAVGEPAVALLGDAPPRAEMNLVDRNRRVQRVARRARGHPLLVLEAVARAINDRGGRRRQLQRGRPRISLEVRRALVRTNFILVARAGLEPRDEQFPDSRPAHRTHHVDAAVPSVEVADHAEAACVGCPDCERHPGDAAQIARMSAEYLVRSLVLEFAKQVEIEIPEGWLEAIWIACRYRSAAAKKDLELISEQLTPILQPYCEYPCRMNARHLTPARFTVDAQGDALGVGPKCPHHHAVGLQVSAENGMWIEILERDQVLQAVCRIVRTGGRYRRLH